jgi:hypothetical protein
VGEGRGEGGGEGEGGGGRGRGKGGGEGEGEGDAFSSVKALHASDSLLYDKDFRGVFAFFHIVITPTFSGVFRSKFSDSTNVSVLDLFQYFISSF